MKKIESNQWYEKIPKEITVRKFNTFYVVEPVNCVVGRYLYDF